MSSNQSEIQADPAKDQELVYGQDRQPGVAGKDGDYILRTVNRWSLRGDGSLK